MAAMPVTVRMLVMQAQVVAMKVDTDIQVMVALVAVVMAAMAVLLAMTKQTAS
jgi:hypothetical protein